MKAIFKIKAINGKSAKGQVYSGEVDVTGKAAAMNPTLPQIVNSLLFNVAGEHPELHLATEMTITVELV